MEKNYRVAVLMGGDSPEREISLASGRAVSASLREQGHEILEVVLQNVAEVASMPELADYDLVFPAMHGGEGEDGHLQALLDLRRIPYALSGPLASSLAMRKSLAKRVMRGAGIPTPDWLLIQLESASGGRLRVGDADGGGSRGRLTAEHLLERAEAEIGFPLVIKPDNDGSSVGVGIVEKADAFLDAFTSSSSSGQDVLIESYVPGRELTAAVFLGLRLPLLEIRPRSGFYDFENKYTAGASDYLVPAPVNSPVYERITNDARRLFDLMGCRGLARVDFRLDGDTYSCLEVNTIPGMTENSLVPKAAAAVGIGFGEMLTDLCRDALERVGGGRSDDDRSKS